MASADEPLTLIGTIVKWRYPESEITKSVMQDGATVDADGNRTIPSTILRTTLVTPDSVEKVLEFYRDLLTRDAGSDGALRIPQQSGVSVDFKDESDGRPFAFHTITVNSENTSTILIITRGSQEDRTYIVWKQYVKHHAGP